jgi:NAD(P)-dependent dehydrogenase (short-subunit alcohol dehydrogenase family)
MPSPDGPDVLAVEGDLAHAQTAQHVAEQTLDRFGRIDSLVNMAGIFIDNPFANYTVEDYAAITAVNLTGLFHMTQHVIAQMVTA